MTNAEYIRNMTDDELAQFLLETSLHRDGCDSKDCVNRHKSCKDCFKEWLGKEHKT